MPKTILITGAGRGIGRAIARRLKDQNLILVTKTEASQRSLKEEFPKAFCYAADLTRQRDIDEFVRTTRGLTKSLDVLVNNAGTYIAALFEETSAEQLDQQYAIHLRAPFILTKELLPLLRKGTNPVVINVSSAATFSMSPKEAAYTAAKTALTAFTDVIREELQKDNIRFTVIQPFGVNTWSDPHPEKLLRPEDVAETAVFIMNTDPNCQILRIDMSSVQEWRRWSKKI